MIPASVYTVEASSWSSVPDYRIECDGETLYRTETASSATVSFVTDDGEPAFSVTPWGLSDPRYGYAVRDGDGEPLGWIADDTPLLGRRLAIRTMEDTTLGTLGDAGWLGKLLFEASRELPVAAPAELLLRTPEGQRIGVAKRGTGARTYSLALEDVGLDHRLVLAALVVLNNRDALDRVLAMDDA